MTKFHWKIIVDIVCVCICACVLVCACRRYCTVRYRTAVTRCPLSLASHISLVPLSLRPSAVCLNLSSVTEPLRFNFLLGWMLLSVSFCKQDSIQHLLRRDLRYCTLDKRNRQVTAFHTLPEGTHYHRLGSPASSSRAPRPKHADSNPPATSRTLFDHLCVPQDPSTRTCRTSRTGTSAHQ